jgi:hypothetical protein
VIPNRDGHAIDVDVEVEQVGRGLRDELVQARPGQPGRTCRVGRDRAHVDDAAPISRRGDRLGR